VTKTDTNSFPEFKRKVWRKAGELVIRRSVVSRQGFAKSRAGSWKIPSKVKKRECPMFEGWLQPMQLIRNPGKALLVFGPRNFRAR
jgi:hypothetical protein